MTTARSGAGWHMREGDRVRYTIDGRCGAASKFLQDDGDVFVTFDDGRKLYVNCNHLEPENAVSHARGPVTQEWVHDLSFMMQSVLLTAIRGPDGVRKDHVAKLVCRWLRRCVLLSAFDRTTLFLPEDPRGGSFTGPSVRRQGPSWQLVGDQGGWFNSRDEAMDEIVSRFIRATDELPHHFTMHIKNAAQVIGFKHPMPEISQFWLSFYLRLCDDMHDNPERLDQFEKRLGDDEGDWLAAGDRSSCGREDCAPGVSGATAYTFAGERPNPRDRTQIDPNFKRDANVSGGCSTITGVDLGEEEPR